MRWTPNKPPVLGTTACSTRPQRFIARLIQLHGAGRFPFDRLVTFYDFNGINRAIADVKRGSTIKAVLRMGSRPAGAR